MKFRHLLLVLLAGVSLAASCSAAEVPASVGVLIGKTKIALPIPPGFAPPSATPKALSDVMSHALPPTNRLVAIMLTQDFVDKQAAGLTTTPLSRYMGVQTFPAYEESGITPALFEQVKTMLRTQSAQLIEKAKAGVGEATDRMSADVGKLTGDSTTQIKTGDNSSLGVFDEQPDSISIAALQTVSATSRTTAVQVRQAMGLASVRIQGKLLMVSVYSNYASQADIDWVENQVRAWVKRLNELNR